MNRKWLSALSALVMVVGVATGGGTALAKENYKTNAVITEAEIAAIKEYAIGVGPNHTYLNEDYVQKVVNSGLEIHPYTVNEKERMKQLIDWGVTGMFTNFPDELHEVKKGK